MLEVFGLSICCLQPHNFRTGSLSFPATRRGLTPASLPEGHIVSTLAGVKKKTSSILVCWTLYLEQEGNNCPKPSMFILLEPCP